MERAWIYTIDLRKVHECHATMDPSEKEQRYLTYQLTFLLSYGWKMSGASRKKPPSSPHLCQPVGYRRVIGCAQKVISRVQKIVLGNTSMNIWSRAPWAPERGIQIRRRNGNIKVGES